MKEHNWREERIRYTTKQAPPVTEDQIVEKEQPKKSSLPILFIVVLIVVIAAGVLIYCCVSSKTEQIVIPDSQTQSNHHSDKQYDSSDLPEEQKPQENKPQENKPQENKPQEKDHQRKEVAQILNEAARAIQAGDYQTAAKKLKMAADKGDAFAQYHYAVWLLDGKYVKKDNVQAEKYLKMSAEQGYNHALAFYGISLISGGEFPKNPKKGEAMLWNVSDDKTLPIDTRFLVFNALFHIETFDKDLSCEEFLKLHRKGRRGIEYCAAQKYKKAIEFLEKCVLEPNYFLVRFLLANKDLKDYCNLYLSVLCKIAEEGNKETQLQLFYIFFGGGKWFPRQYEEDLGDAYRDNSKAFHYLKMAAENEHPDALTFLALFHLRGEFVPYNYELAYKYLKRAAELGSKSAKRVLNEMSARNGEVSSEIKLFTPPKISLDINKNLEKRKFEIKTLPEINIRKLIPEQISAGQ